MEGWICPKCGRVWAFWVKGCGNCNVSKTYTSNTTTTHFCLNPNTDGSCGCGLSRNSEKEKVN